jgi:hypothetical protein
MEIKMKYIVDAVRAAASKVRPTISYGSCDFDESYKTAEAIADAFDMLADELDSMDCDGE